MRAFNWLSLLLLGWLSAIGSAASSAGVATARDVQVPSCGSSGSVFRTVGYYQSWNIQLGCNRVYPSQLNVDGYTHLIMAYLTIDPTTFQVHVMHTGDEELYRQFLALPDTASKWIGIVAGGGDFKNPGPAFDTWSRLIASKDNRAIFVASLKQFLDQWKFHGVDIDWHWPFYGGAFSDKVGQVALLKEIREALGREIGLSSVVSPQQQYLRYLDIKAIEANVDWLTVLTRDLHGPWESSTEGLKAHTDYKEIDGLLSSLSTTGIDPKKLNLALANYARGYTLADKNCVSWGCPFKGPSRPGQCSGQIGVLSECELIRAVNDGLSAPWKIIAGGAQTNWMTWDDQWFTFDDGNSRRQKLELANQHCMGGTTLWSINYGYCNYDVPLPGPGSSIAPSLPGPTSLPAASIAPPGSSSPIIPSSHGQSTMSAVPPQSSSAPWSSINDSARPSSNTPIVIVPSNQGQSTATTGLLQPSSAPWSSIDLPTPPSNSAPTVIAPSSHTLPGTWVGSSQVSSAPSSSIGVPLPPSSSVLPPPGSTSSSISGSPSLSPSTPGVSWTGQPSTPPMVTSQSASSQPGTSAAATSGNASPSFQPSRQPSWTAGSSTPHPSSVVSWSQGSSLSMIPVPTSYSHGSSALPSSAYTETQPAPSFSLAPSSNSYIPSSSAPSSSRGSSSQLSPIVPSRSIWLPSSSVSDSTPISTPAPSQASSVISSFSGSSTAGNFPTIIPVPVPMPSVSGSSSPTDRSTPVSSSLSAPASNSAPGSSAVGSSIVSNGPIPSQSGSSSTSPQSWTPTASFQSPLIPSSTLPAASGTTVSWVTNTIPSVTSFQPPVLSTAVSQPQSSWSASFVGSSASSLQGTTIALSSWPSSGGVSMSWGSSWTQPWISSGLIPPSSQPTLWPGTSNGPVLSTGPVLSEPRPSWLNPSGSSNPSMIPIISGTSHLSGVPNPSAVPNPSDPSKPAEPSKPSTSAPTNTKPSDTPTTKPSDSSSGSGTGTATSTNSAAPAETPFCPNECREKENKDWCEKLCDKDHGLDLDIEIPKLCFNFWWCLLWYGHKIPLPHARGPKCKLLGCGCGFLGLPFGPGCPPTRGPEDLILDTYALFPDIDFCRWFGCDGGCGILGCDGFCFGVGGCGVCPPMLCPGRKPKPGPMPTPPPNGPPKPSGTPKPEKPKKCAEKDYKTMVERIVYCGEFKYLSPSLSMSTVFSTWVSTVVSTSTSATTSCHTIMDATVEGCNLGPDTITTISATVTSSNSISSSDAPACTRAPLSLDDDEGPNDPPDWLSSSISFASNTTMKPPSTSFSASLSTPLSTSNPWDSANSTSMWNPAASSSGSPSSVWSSFAAASSNSSMSMISSVSSTVNSTSAWSSTATSVSNSASMSNSAGSCMSSSASVSSSGTTSKSIKTAPSASNPISFSSSASWTQESSVPIATSTAPQSSWTQETSVPIATSQAPSPSSSTQESSVPIATSNAPQSLWTEETSVPIATSKVPQPSPGPMDRFGKWNVSCHQWMEGDSSKFEWVLFDPNGFQAGKGDMMPMDGKADYKRYIESQGRPEQHMMPFGIDAWNQHPTDSEKAQVYFHINKEMAGCGVSAENSCSPYWKTENRLENLKFEVETCWENCKSKQDVKLLPSDINCEDMNEADWGKTAKGWERKFWCWFKAF